VSRKLVMCEVDPDTKRVIRILKHDGEAIFLKPERVLGMSGYDAEKDIKRQLIKIQRDECPYCSRPVNMSSHLHERQWRSKGGTPSLANSVVICAKCHIIGPKSEHGKRAPQWSRA